MPNRPVVIDSFVDLPGNVEIVGVGAVRQPRGEAQEVEIQVVVASDMDAAGFDPARDVTSRWLGCGQLDMLVPGSLWKEGRHVGRALGKTVEAAFEFVRAENVGIGEHPQPTGRPFPSRRFAGALGFLLKRIHGPAGGGKDRPGDPEFVLLPVMELLRSLFGVSNGFLLELFDGIRDPAVSGERGLVSRERSCVGKDGTVFLAAGRALTRDEAIMAAAVVSDEKVRRLYHSAFQELSVRKEARDGHPLHLNLTWPWRVPVPIGLEGRWVARTNGTRRFIASRVAAIGIPLPFDKVEVRHPGAEKGRGEDLPPPEGRSRSANARIVVLTTGRAGSSGRRSAEVATGITDLTTATEIQVVDIACGGAARHDPGGIGEEPRDAASFGSGGRQPGADPDVGRAMVRRRAKPGETADRSQVQALEITWNALRAACASRRWALRALRSPGQPFRNAAHGGLDFEKEPLVAVVEAGGKRLIVVDRGSPAGDECSLGLLVPRESGAALDSLAASARAACTSVDGRWRSVNLRAPRFRVHAVNRAGDVWRNADAYTKMLSDRIASVLDF